MLACYLISKSCLFLIILQFLSLPQLYENNGCKLYDNNGLQSQIRQSFEISNIFNDHNLKKNSFEINKNICEKNIKKKKNSSDFLAAV